MERESVPTSRSEISVWSLQLLLIIGCRCQKAGSLMGAWRLMLSFLHQKALIVLGELSEGGMTSEWSSISSANQKRRAHIRKRRRFHSVNNWQLFFTDLWPNLM